jgi:hypothetical protein
MSIGGYDAGPRHGNPHLKNAKSTAPAMAVDDPEEDPDDDAEDLDHLKTALKAAGVTGATAAKVVKKFVQLDSQD